MEQKFWWYIKWRVYSTSVPMHEIHIFETPGKIADILAGKSKLNGLDVGTLYTLLCLMPDGKCKDFGCGSLSMVARGVEDWARKLELVTA